jgi:hypothetical protein
MTFKPKRVAAPRVIYDAASALAGQVEASTRIDDDRDRWYNAIAKAASQLMDGVRFEQDGDDMIFPSRSRSGISHRVNGVCTCEAWTERRQPCWHRAAAKIIVMIEDAERRQMAPPPAPLTPAYRCIHCGSPTEPDDEHFVCLNRACGRAMSIELFELLDAPPTAEQRTGVSREQAMREIDELYA